MGIASLAGRVFNVDPTAVEWNYSVLVADLQTVGGKVVQVYGASVSDLTITGAFAGGWKEQVDFLSFLQRIGTTQVTNPAADPVSFVYPTKGWNFLVFLKTFTDVAGGSSVVFDNANFGPRWELTLQIADATEGRLNSVAMDAFITRLSDGMGWQETAYNGGAVDASFASTIQQPLNALQLQETPGSNAPAGTVLPSAGGAAVGTTGDPPPAPPPPPTDEQLRQWWVNVNGASLALGGGPIPSPQELRAEWNNTASRAAIFGRTA